jgi:hypothetical protein
VVSDAGGRCFFWSAALVKFSTPARYSGSTIERILALQKIYRRMLTFMITPMANIIDDEAKLRYPFHS